MLVDKFVARYKLQLVVDSFGPELKPILQEKTVTILQSLLECHPILQKKIINILQRRLSEKKHERNIKQEKTLKFQRAWLKLLDEEIEEKNEIKKQLYLKAVRAIIKNKACDQELSKHVNFFLLENFSEFETKSLEKLKKIAKHNIAFLLSKRPGYEKPKGSFDEPDLDRARSVDLYDLAGTKHSRGNVLCPLHKERTGSFHIYPNNTFYCFGCGEYGDAIHFVQKVHHLNFKEAVSFLLTIK